MRSHGSKVYAIRIGGHLGPISLAAFPEMAVQQRCDDCILTGELTDGSALFGVAGLGKDEEEDQRERPVEKENQGWRPRLLSLPQDR